MKVTLSYKKSPQQAFLYKEPCDQVALASGSVVICPSDRGTIVIALEDIGDLIIEKENKERQKEPIKNQEFPPDVFVLDRDGPLRNMDKE